MILVFGKSGQLASAFRRIIPSSAECLFLSSDDANFSEPGSAGKAIQKYQPKLIINCSAYTAVDKAETEIERCLQINASALGEIGAAAQKISSRILHFSTDYVFPGSGVVVHAENDRKLPLNAYGRAKLSGEALLNQSGAFFHTIRISWVYSAQGTNFVKTMLKLGREREELKIVGDQIGSPMSAEAIASLLWKTSIPSLLNPVNQDRSTYNLSSAPFVSWFEFAQAIFEEAGELDFPLKVKSLIPLPTSEYPTPAKRPFNSRMSDEKFKARYGCSLPPWRESLREVLVELRAEQLSKEVI